MNKLWFLILVFLVLFFSTSCSNNIEPDIISKVQSQQIARGYVSDFYKINSNDLIYVSSEELDCKECYSFTYNLEEKEINVFVSQGEASFKEQ